jgi:hypothetical protein
MIYFIARIAVGLDKVSFCDGVVTGGLKATKRIKMTTPILATCGSMSSDVVTERAISVVKVGSSQLKPLASRLVFGPFGFVNHDCEPNCKVIPLPHCKQLLKRYNCSSKL